MIKKLIVRTFCVLGITLMALGILFPNQVAGMSAEQKKLFSSGILYFDINTCAVVSASVVGGNGDGYTLAAPSLKDKQVLVDAINAYIKEKQPSSPFAGMGEDIVTGAMNAGINPLAIVYHLQKESSFGTAPDPQVLTAFNAFGRTATESQPHIVGARLWYKWDSWKASLNAPGDQPSYMKEQFVDGAKFDINTLNYIDSYLGMDAAANDAYKKEMTTLMQDFIEVRAVEAFGAGGTGSSGSPGSIVANATANGKVYMIGDSITQGTEGHLRNALTGKGFKDVDIDGLASRTLSQGIEVLENSKDRWSNANTIIIELGTNGGASAADIAKTMDIIQEGNKTGVKVYWVNIGVDQLKRSTPLDAAGTNAQLQQSSPEGYVIIDWASQVAAHPGYIKSDGYGVHPSEEGSPAFAETVANGAIAGGGIPANSPNPNCVCKPGTSSNLAGSDNAEKTWNFLIGKGLSPEQAAGIMGNLKAEAHFEPRLVEYGWPNSRGETSKAGQPSSLDDQVPPNANGKGQPGYGIVQWTSPGRKQGLIDKAAATGQPVSDLGLQLEYLWDELQGPYKNTVYDPIMSMTTVAEVSKVFLYDFENPGEKEKQTPIREGFGNEFLALYGSNTAGPVAAGTSACGGGGNGEVVGGFSLPVDKKFYESNPEWFTDPHHTYPASDMPVPEGTPIYSMTAGKIVKAPTGPAVPVGADAPGGDKCGAGVTIEVAPGVQFLYCHGSDGGSVDGAKEGDTVQAGQLIMHSSHTGHTIPSGPAGTHLHLGITVDGIQRCPQTLLKSIADGSPIQDLKTLPSSGCVGS